MRFQRIFLFSVHSLQVAPLTSANKALLGCVNAIRKGFHTRVSCTKHHTMLTIAYAVVVIFLAAIVRGFSGFGFSMLTITALSLFYPTAEIVPSIFMLELAASLKLLPSIWKDIHWRSLGPLTLGCVIATPIGVWFLAHIAPAPMQLALAVFVLIATGLLAVGYAVKRVPGPIVSTLAGAASGLANGAFGIGGPPVILFYFSSPAGAAAGRASLTAFFLATDVIGLANQSYQGLITWAAVYRAALWLPPLIAGVWVGAHSFKSVDQALFRKVVLALLALMAMAIGVKALLALQ